MEEAEKETNIENENYMTNTNMRVKAKSVHDNTLYNYLHFRNFYGISPFFGKRKSSLLRLTLKEI